MLLFDAVDSNIKNIMLMLMLKNVEFRRIFDEVCETSKGYAKRSQKEEEKED